MLAAETERPRSFTKDLLAKGAEWGGLIGGALFLLTGNVQSAIVGVGIAFVGYLIDKG